MGNSVDLIGSFSLVFIGCLSIFALLADDLRVVPIKEALLESAFKFDSAFFVDSLGVLDHRLLIDELTAAQRALFDIESLTLGLNREVGQAFSVSLLAFKVLIDALVVKEKLFLSHFQPQQVLLCQPAF